MATPDKESLRLVRHQLKAPLTVIKGYLSFWETDAYSKFPADKQHDFILKALQAAKTLEAQLDDVLSEKSSLFK